MKPNGAIAYRGPSRIGEGDVVLILTGISVPSGNSKTGEEIQGYILGTAEDPLRALWSGRDEHICGACPHRRYVGGSCYVNVAWAPNNIYKVFKRGGYPDLDPEWLRGRKVRWGAYGDPAAVPAEVYLRLLPLLRGWQGFTHQWRSLEERVWADFLMASVDDEGEAVVAQLRGWRTFRVRTSAESELLPFERVCPASKEAGYILDCARCGQCDGNRRGAGRPNRVIAAHGSGAARYLQPSFLSAVAAPLGAHGASGYLSPTPAGRSAPGGSGALEGVGGSERGADEGGAGGGPMGGQLTLSFFGS